MFCHFYILDSYTFHLDFLEVGFLEARVEVVNADICPHHASNRNDISLLVSCRK